MMRTASAVITIEPIESTFPDRQRRMIKVVSEDDNEWIGHVIGAPLGIPITYPKFAWKRV